MTAPLFARQIKGRPKTDKRDCQWIQRLHKHGLLPPVFQPDEATQTLRDSVRQRANLVRLSMVRSYSRALFGIRAPRFHTDQVAYPRVRGGVSGPPSTATTSRTSA